MDRSWKKRLGDELTSPYMRELFAFLKQERASDEVYPAQREVFRAFEVPFSKVQVVIVGQDPYQEKADGLAFSVSKGGIPPSLRNIFKELEEDLGVKTSEDGSLERWAKQGVLLLNVCMTVGKGRSHRGKGWEHFTERVVEVLAAKEDPLVFILWGKKAQKFERVIGKQHLVLKAPHPSPHSAWQGFFKSRPFSKANRFLTEAGKKGIVWG